MIDDGLLDRLLTAPQSGSAILREAGGLDSEHLSALLVRAADLAHSDAEAAQRLADLVQEVAPDAQAPEVGPAADHLSARLLVQSGDPESALRYIGRARDGYQRLGADLAALRTDLGRMHVLDDLGRHAEATAVGHVMLTALTAMATTSEIAGLRAAAFGNVGVSLGFTGRHEEAIEAYRRAESIWRALGQDREASADLANQGIELVALGDAAAGLACLQRATSEFETGDDPQWLGKCLGHRGAALATLGRYVEALADYERARTLLGSVGDGTECWRLSIETAATLLALGLADEAAGLVLEVAPRLRQAGLHHDRATAAAVLGRAQAKAGRLDAARAALTEAAQLYELVNDPPNRAGVLLDLSRVSEEDAVAHARTAADLLHGRSWPGVRCLTQVRLAELTAHDVVTASDHLAEAQLLADELGMPHLRLAVAEAQGALLRRAGDLDGAIRRFSEAVALVEGVGTALLDEILRSAFLRSSGSARQGLISALLERGTPEDVDRAARLADEGKARTLVDVRYGIARPRAVGADEISLSLASQLSVAYSALFSADPDRREAVRARVEGLERRIAVHGALAPPSSTRARPAAAQPNGPTPATVTYHVIDGQIVAFVPQRGGGYAVQKVSDVASVSSLLDDLEAHLGRHAAGVVARYGAERAQACQRVLAELYLRIFAPVRPMLPPPRGVPRPLVIVPHGLLHRVPFHALHDGRDHLLARWVITIAPSLAAVQLGPAPAATTAAAVVGVADQTTPLIEDEARAVAAAMAEGAAAARLLLGADATLARVRDVMDGAAIVHLACHGLFRFANPAFSSLRLADRWARAADLVDACLDGATLVLSACETARVDPDQGHEATGLARSFLAAGARCVVVSQWVADDRSTRELMVRLHEGLARGADAAAALRAAQLCTMIDFPHPFHWAPFIAVGAPSATEDS